MKNADHSNSLQRSSEETVVKLPKAGVQEVEVSSLSLYDKE